MYSAAGRRPPGFRGTPYRSPPIPGRGFQRGGPLPPLCAQRGYGGRWLTPLRHYDSRPLRAANRAVSSKSGRLIRRWRRLSRFPPCFRWGAKGKVPLREQEKNAPIPIPLGRERKASWCHPNSRPIEPPFCLLCYGEGAVGVSAPAPPLSFLRCRRDSLSVKSLSVSLSSGLLLRRHRGLIIIAVFRRFVKR